MTKKRLIDLALVFAAVAVLTALAFFVTPGVKADTVALLKTSGVTCKGCVSSIADALGKQKRMPCDDCASRIVNEVNSRKGVAWVKVDMDGGRVVVGYDSRSIRPEAIAASVTGAGYASSVAQVVSVEQYCKMFEGNPAAGIIRKNGCGGICGLRDRLPKGGEQ